MKAAVILGAGFSKNCGIPLESEIPELLATYCSPNGFEKAATQVILKFMTDVFGYRKGGNFPFLGDIFTSIDLSTNSGHHLGLKYTPMHLRCIRRLMVYRMFSILENSYKPSSDVNELLKLLREKYSDTGYVVLNWDTSLEKQLAFSCPYFYPDYCSRILPVSDDIALKPEKHIKIAKVHGSDNWLYCDNCRGLFHCFGRNVNLLENAGFHKTDLELFDELKETTEISELKGSTCPVCGDGISSHIATFSYRKTFRSNSFPDIWVEAEKILSEADRWIFIGYSLPDADYEFKHLLKIAQLKLNHKRSGSPAIDVVLLDGEALEKFKGFFGSSTAFLCRGGIDAYISHMKV